MLVKKPPLETLVDSFIYEEYLSDDGDWGKAEYAPEKEIKNVRIDRGSQYSNSSSGKQLLYNAVIFCYPNLTTPCPKFVEQSRITIGNRTMIITKVDTVVEPYEPKVYCYELEVV